MEKFFQLKARGTTVQTEVRAGVATFLTMAYIVVVNPVILGFGGMPPEGVVFATVLVAGISSILMGLIANLPFALAPGMGINAFFAFTLVGVAGGSWQTALGAVFISGIVFLILSLLKVRELIVGAIPPSIRYAVAAGIGVFLAFIGLNWAGFIADDPATLVAAAPLSAKSLVFVLGLFLTSFLVVKKIKGALIYGIIGTSLMAFIGSALAAANGGSAFVSNLTGVFAMPDTSVFFALDIQAALTLGMVLPIFTLLFTDMFDSISTFVGVAEVGGFMDEKTGKPRDVGKALFVDAISTTISGLVGSSSGTTYIESAAGVEEGGKTGLTAIVTGLLFLPLMFLSPLLVLVPQVAVAPVMILIGIFMVKPLVKIKWSQYEESIPAFVALILIPLTYSITEGIIWGFLTHTIIKLFIGKAREIPVTLWIIDLFAILALAVKALA